MLLRNIDNITSMFFTNIDSLDVYQQIRHQFIYSFDCKPDMDQFRATPNFTDENMDFMKNQVSQIKIY